MRSQDLSDLDIQTRLDMIKNGNAEKVRLELPRLEVQYPNNAGVLYLQAVLTSNGTEAVKYYQKIVDTYPNSKWAEDALYKIYQYYYAMGFYRTAEHKLDLLRQNYPNSPYVTGTAKETATPSNSTIAQQPAAKPLSKQEPVVTKPDTTKQVQQPKAISQTSAMESQQKPQEKKAVTTTPAVQQKPKAAVSNSSTGSFTIQMGVFAVKENAEKMQAQLSSAGITAEVKLKQLGSKEMYAVYVGVFSSREEARRQNEIYKAKDISGVIVSK